MSIIKKIVAKLAGKREASPFEFNRIKSVLIKPIGDAIGDAIAHTAHLTQLKKANPNLKIGVLVTKRNKDIFEMSDLVDVFLEDKFLTYLKERDKWDLYLDFQPTFTTKSILQDKILSPNKIIIFNKKNKKYYNTEKIKNYDSYCPQESTTHISDYLSFSILKENINQDHAKYNLKNDHFDKFDGLWENKFRILLAPEGSTRKIPERELGNLLNNLSDNIKSNSKFILAYTKESQLYRETLVSHFGNNIELELSPPTNLKEYIQLVASADLIIAVDSGTIHIAAALQQSMLAFYARNMENFYRWRPKVDNSTPYKAILSNTESQSNNDTFDFPMNEAAEWVNDFYQQHKKR